MSRWWPEPLRLGLGDEQVEVIRCGRGLRRHNVRDPARTTIQPFDAAPGGAAPWSSALDALDEALQRSGVRDGAARAVLSTRWVRYDVLRWHDDVHSQRELEQLARLRFQRTYGGPPTAGTCV